MTRYEETRCLNLSTAHIRSKTALWLRDHQHELPVAVWDYGFFLCVPEDAGDKHPDTPADLSAVFAFVRRKGFDWLRFDCDVPVIPDLLAYDWEAERTDA